MGSSEINVASNMRDIHKRRVRGSNAIDQDNKKASIENHTLRAERVTKKNERAIKSGKGIKGG
eukprot:CAMPEP_0195511516 /NCGR_PEP_ID=MMETSP0794_2-20130614/3804_1 /TAXON_ID=515487 /ORGANISM="Stephanopyxis turris, Strain CCMP 815" /LENGTH=62 /DNA_ID=CAMNT_0040639121 /DNA_START=209 /DNA_END=394 /DNA_ORIENTATION=+